MAKGKRMPARPHRALPPPLGNGGGGFRSRRGHRSPTRARPPPTSAKQASTFSTVRLADDVQNKPPAPSARRLAGWAACVAEFIDGVGSTRALRCDAGVVANDEAAGPGGPSSSISRSLSNRLAGPEVDQMNFAAVQTTYRIERIGIVARRLLNEEALHSRSRDGTAKETWYGGIKGKLRLGRP